MSQLIYRSYISSPAKDEVIAEFPGPAVATLGWALKHFSDDVISRAKRIVAGEIPHVPIAICNIAMELLKNPDVSFPYTVKHSDKGFSIWISDGPDRYDLID